MARPRKRPGTQVARTPTKALTAPTIVYHGEQPVIDLHALFEAANRAMTRNTFAELKQFQKKARFAVAIFTILAKELEPFWELPADEPNRAPHCIDVCFGEMTVGSFFERHPQNLIAGMPIWRDKNLLARALAWQVFNRLVYAEGDERIIFAPSWSDGKTISLAFTAKGPELVKARQRVSALTMKHLIL